MRLIHIAVLLSLMGLLAAQQCDVPGVCQGTLIGTSLTESEQECIHFCQSTGDCAWYTYNPDDSDCLAFSSCSAEHQHRHLSSLHLWRECVWALSMLRARPVLRTVLGPGWFGLIKRLPGRVQRVPWVWVVYTLCRLWHLPPVRNLWPAWPKLPRMHLWRKRLWISR